MPPLSEARRLLDELRDQATDRRFVDNLSFECQRVLAVVAAFPPFATLVFERWADHRGVLGVPAEAGTRQTA